MGETSTVPTNFLLGLVSVSTGFVKMLSEMPESAGALLSLCPSDEELPEILDHLLANYQEEL